MRQPLNILQRRPYSSSSVNLSLSNFSMMAVSTKAVLFFTFDNSCKTSTRSRNVLFFLGCPVVLRLPSRSYAGLPAPLTFSARVRACAAATFFTLFFHACKISKKNGCADKTFAFSCLILSSARRFEGFAPTFNYYHSALIVLHTLSINDSLSHPLIPISSNSIPRDI